MAKPPPFNKTEERRLKQLHAQGMSLNRIAKTMHRSNYTISKHAKRLGLTFDRSATDRMTKAHRSDAAKLRVDLTIRLLQEARGMLDDLHKPQLVYSFANNGSYHEHEMIKPPPADARNIMTSVGIALQRSIELARVDQQSETPVTVIDEYLKTLGVG